METRTITQIKIYELLLNPMSCQAEEIRLVAISTEKIKLLEFYSSQKTEPYYDDNWRKTFIAGGPLEWYNPESNIEQDQMGYFGHGIKEDWINQESYEYYKNNQHLINFLIIE